MPTALTTGWPRALVVFGLALLGAGATSPAQAVGDVAYTVKMGDTPASIAHQLKLPLTDLLWQVGGVLSSGQEIVVCPPGDETAKFPSQYLEFYTVPKGQTLVQVAQVLKMGVEELADFNGLPRRYHLVQRGERLSDLAVRYRSVLQPVADSHQVTVETLIQDWHELGDGPELPEGRLLLVGWTEPALGDRLAYPLVEKIIASVENDMRKEGLLTPKGAQFFSDKVQYQLYAVKEGDTLETLAAELAKSKETWLQSLCDVNGLEKDTKLTVGQVLFVPTAESAFGGSSAQGYRAYPRPGARLWALPTTRANCREVPVKDKQGKREVLWVFERPWVQDAGGRAVMTKSTKTPWAWMMQRDMEFDPPDKKMLFYAIGRADVGKVDIPEVHPLLRTVVAA